MYVETVLTYHQAAFFMDLSMWRLIPNEGDGGTEKFDVICPPCRVIRKDMPPRYSKPKPGLITKVERKRR